MEALRTGNQSTEQVELRHFHVIRIHWLRSEAMSQCNVSDTDMVLLFFIAKRAGDVTRSTAGETAGVHQHQPKLC